MKWMNTHYSTEITVEQFEVILNESEKIRYFKKIRYQGLQHLKCFNLISDYKLIDYP